MLEANGLEYEAQGQGEPVLLIHGAFISDALLPVAREAALAKRHRVIWYRRRGYGGSDPVSPPFSIEQQAGDAHALLDHLGVEQAHVVGHSGGGVIATQLALQAPQLVRSLVLLEPAIMPPALGAAFPEMLAPAMQAYRSGNISAAVDAFMNMVAPEPDWRTELAKTLPAGPEQADRDAPVTFDVDLPQVAEWVFDGDRAARLSPPILYVSGSESGPLIEALRDHFVSLVPKAEVVELPGLDHSMTTKGPGLVAEAVAKFLARQAGRA
jgi:pimeloyl-ACP methyl ester carboxylesterase